ncbi:MAG: hypothetical protein ACJAUG_002362 [Halioglobus sp.]|jgi:hypothetical protein
MAQEDSKLSTSALARELEIPAQQLFATLKDYGWIERHGDNWTLTHKGEFEGGSYQNSRRFGRYIVWPKTLEQHPLVQAIESNQRITAAGMHRYYGALHPRQINRSLAELGLQAHSILGWELTDFGRRLGGQQEESDNTGAYYVTWPHEIVDHPVVHRELIMQSGEDPAQDETLSTEPPADLFDSVETVVPVHRGVDGHILSKPLEVAVCNWLYMAQLVHAHQRALPTPEQVSADFYVPAGSVYIDCWDSNEPVAALSSKLLRRELYREHELRHIEINAEDKDRLDEVLGRGLHALGIRC